MVIKVQGRNFQVCLVKMRFFAILPYCNIWQDLATTFFWKFSSSFNVKHLQLVRASLCLDGNQHRKILELIFWVLEKGDLEQIFHIISYQHISTSWNITFSTFSACLSCWVLAETFVKMSFKASNIDSKCYYRSCYGISLQFHLF